MASVAVMGAGPAGVAAAVQLARSGHEVAVYESGKVGGTVRNARLVENYPGFPNGITGLELAALLERQLARFVSDIVSEEVVEIRMSESRYSIITSSGERGFDAAVICTGTSPVKAGFEGEDELAIAGLLAYEIADLDLEGAEKVGIVGGGEASMDYALALVDKGLDVTLVHRSGPGAVKALYDTARAEGRIEWVRACVSEAARCDTGIILKTDSGDMAFDRVLVAVGREPTLPPMSGSGLKPGTLLIAGDARHGRLGQVALAVGEGMKAALDLDRELRDEA